MLLVCLRFVLGTVPELRKHVHRVTLENNSSVSSNTYNVGGGNRSLLKRFRKPLERYVSSIIYQRKYLFILKASIINTEQLYGKPGGGGTSLWVRRGCAPVLGSFWPENSGIGVSFYWKISVIGVYFHSEFSGIGDYSKFCNGC